MLKQAVCSQTSHFCEFFQPPIVVIGSMCFARMSRECPAPTWGREERRSISALCLTRRTGGQRIPRKRSTGRLSTQKGFREGLWHLVPLSTQKGFRVTPGVSWGLHGCPRYTLVLGVSHGERDSEGMFSFARFEMNGSFRAACARRPLVTEPNLPLATRVVM